MSTKLKSEFNRVLQFEDDTDRVEHDSKILMFKFLSLIETEMENKGMNKKNLAHLLETSPSYVTQLFRGNKTINLYKLAQLQLLFNIEFDVQIVPKGKQKIKSTKSIKKTKVKSLVTAR